MSHVDYTTHRQRGFTLLELTLVTVILGIVAASVAPNFSSGDASKLDLGAAEIAAALNFARAQARLSGEHYAVQISPVTQNIKVYKVDLGTTPLSAAFTATDPIAKKPYQFNLAARPGLHGVTITNPVDPFLYSDSARRKSVVFDAQGTPLWINTSSGVTSLLIDGRVELDHGAGSRTVRVHRIVGRIGIE